MIRILIVAATCMFLAGCAKYDWIPGPNAVNRDFGMQNAQCSLMARHGGGGFVAAGSPNFVAGAAVGAAVGNAVRTQQDYNDCMAATGWQPVEQK